MMSFLILNTIIGAQTLASVSAHLNATLGIVIISLVSLIVTFLGYRVLHWQVPRADSSGIGDNEPM